MLAAAPTNSKPIVSVDVDCDEPYAILGAPGVMTKLEMSSSSDEDDGEIDVDDFIDDCGKFKDVVDVDSVDCRTITTAADSSSDSVTSFGSNSDEQEDLAALEELYGQQQQEQQVDVDEEEHKEPEEEEEEEPYIPPKFRKMRSSIKIASLQEVIPVNEKRGSWMQLPKPDMAQLRRAQTLPTYLKDSESNSTPSKRSGSVTFQNVCIRSYDQTIGDNPSVSYGPPISLDWGFQEMKPISVDDYEENRGERRQLKQMGLSYYHRMAVLQNAFGYSEAELKAAQRNAHKDKMKREVTRFFLPVQVLEDVAQSGVRKFKRNLQRRRQSTI